jgi:hypothetical protein
MASANDPFSSSEPRVSTGGATPPSFHEAAHAVLNTNELLREIISYLPFEDIIAATGVCKTWRYALKASVAIQQALFLAPITTIRRIKTNLDLSLPTRIEDIPRESYTVVGELHPSFARICGPLLSNDTFFREVAVMPPRQSFEHPAGLWRDMLITQPPVSCVHVCLYSTPMMLSRVVFPPGFTDPRGEIDSLRCDEGIRMGQLYDLIESKTQALPPPKHVVVSVEMPGLVPEDVQDKCWEVRKGKVVNENLPELVSVLCDDES